MNVGEIIKRCIVNVEFMDGATVLQSRLDLSFAPSGLLTIFLGKLPEVFMGVLWTEADLPLIEAHERAHVKLMEEDQNQPNFKGFEDCSLETQRVAIREEIAAWKTALRNITVEDEARMMEILEKIQILLNTYVFSHLSKEEIYR